jgi:hypothetical protein
MPNFARVRAIDRMPNRYPVPHTRLTINCSDAMRRTKLEFQLFRHIFLTSELSLA